MLAYTALVARRASEAVVGKTSWVSSPCGFFWRKSVQLVNGKLSRKAAMEIFIDVFI
jgi:hypothetical protein